MRKRKNKESIDEVSQGLLIKQKNPKKLHQKIADCSSRKRTKKNKIKGRNQNRNKTTKITKRKLKHQNEKEKTESILMKYIKNKKNEEEN